MAHIFVVDDEEDILDLVSLILTKYGYTLTKFKKGQKVHEEASKNKPDLLLVDLIMPEITGIDVIKQIRADSETKNIPIVIFSALGNKERVDEALEAGANMYLRKPFQINELVEAIENNLKIKK